MVEKLQLMDTSFVVLVLNRNITKNLRFYDINMLSLVLNCFHLSMYFNVIKQVYVFIVLSTKVIPTVMTN